jgi:hypothetical protein
MIGRHDLMISSGFKTPIEAIPTPAFAVPYADPKPICTREGKKCEEKWNVTAEDECPCDADVAKEILSLVTGVSSCCDDIKHGRFNHKLIFYNRSHSKNILSHRYIRVYVLC